MAILSGNIYFKGDSKNYLNKLDIFGTGYFYDDTENIGSICCAFFFNRSKNKGTGYHAEFTDSTINEGIVCHAGNTKFAGSSIN